MPPAAPPATGVLVVRAWLENPPTAPLRAVVTTVDDLSGDEPPSKSTVASVDEVCQLVRAWLQSLQEAGDRDK